MMKRLPASSTLQIDNKRVRVTEWRFPPGSETGWHRHAMDYVVVPMTSGTLLLETPEGMINSNLTAGVSYTRLMGVEHNVINDSDQEIVFIEVEFR
jgi:beta-alanine degradation protein BauB